MNAAIAALFFGLWHWSAYAGMWMFVLLGAIYSAIDYHIESHSQFNDKE